ncbi:hypothetical protein [Actinopolymorpha alba]|uniref:hypothetical protein n=1 Tax=Actinopolymorpha alba TaxID=533267 RepID=UPI00037530BB|nr:hypothetical protein [Actinopolymorpha alba]
MIGSRNLTLRVTPDGPIHDLEAARDAARERRRPGQEVTILVAPGRYPMTRPVRFGPADSGTTVTALDPSDPPTFDGAVTLSAWRESEANGVRVWEATVPTGSARSLFADGRRLPRPRYPREGFLRMAGQPGLDLGGGMIDTLYDGSDSFTYHEGDAWRFRDLEAVEAVVPHYWVEERMPLVELDELRRLARSRPRALEGDPRGKVAVPIPRDDGWAYGVVSCAWSGLRMRLWGRGRWSMRTGDWSRTRLVRPGWGSRCC